MSKRILIVTEYFYPRDRPDSYLLTEITKQLAKTNNGNIQVICNTELEGKEELEFIKDKIIRLNESKFKKDGKLSRIIKLIISTTKLGFKTFSSIQKKDRLISVTNPVFLMIFLGMLKKLKEFNYTLIVYDVFPENLIAAHLLKKESFLYKVTKKIFDWAYSQSDHLIVIGRDMQELIGEKTKDSVSMSLITNWCDVDKIIPKQKKENPIIEEFELEDKIVFAFTGNFGRVQGIDTLLDMAALVKNPKFRLLFIGNGAMLPEIQKHIKNNPNSNVVYAGSFPPSKQNTFLNACDIAIISLNHSMYGLGVPSKSYYNMAAEKPLFYLGDEKSEIGRVVIEHNIGWVFEDKTPKQLADEIDSILDSNLDFNDYGIRARKVVEENFSKEIVLNKYETLFNSNMI